MKRPVIKLPHPLTVLIWVGIAAVLWLFIWCVHWALFVPNDRERLDQCPKREELIAHYEAVERVDPLRAYQRRQWQRHRDYVEKWCQ